MRFHTKAASRKGCGGPTRSQTLGDVRRATEEILEALRNQEISVETATVKLEREVRKDRTLVDRMLAS